MDLELLPHYASYMNYLDRGLNLEQMLFVKESLTILQDENHFRNVYFWGVISGVQKDYYVAYGYRRDAIKGRVYYYSFDARHWVLVPKPKPLTYFLTSIAEPRMFGDPALQLEIMNDDPDFKIPSEVFEADLAAREKERVEKEKQEEEGALEEEGKANEATGGGDAQGGPEEETAFPEETQQPEANLGLPIDIADNATVIEMQASPTTMLKEEDRLGALIRLINRDAGVIPRGALYKHPDGTVVVNKSFHGLNLEQAQLLSNYYHMRVPQMKYQEILSLRTRPDYGIDFLDPVHLDIPKAYSWVLQLQSDNEVAVLKSLHWPGMTMFHHIETNKYGSLYMGDGKKNLDIPFLIP